MTERDYTDATIVHECTLDGQPALVLKLPDGSYDLVAIGADSGATAYIGLHPELMDLRG